MFLSEPKLNLVEQYQFCYKITDSMYIIYSEVLDNMHNKDTGQ